MPKTIQEVADEIKAELGSDLDGYYVKVADDLTDNVLIGNEILAFAISRNEIDDNLHMRKAKQSLPFLKIAVAQAYATMAARADLKVAQQTIEAYARSAA